MKLYTIPYAGGFSFTYLKWKKYLNPEIELIPIELPGRSLQNRLRPCSTIQQMANHVVRQIDEYDSGDYCLFGHSMGALVLLEVYSKLILLNRRLPVQVILSGMKPPHLYESRGHHLLDPIQFRVKMYELGGIPAALAEDREFSDFVFELLRNDIQAVEQYQREGQEPVFNGQVSLFSSESDIAGSDMLEWQNYALLPCTYHSFQGSHFFINEHTAEVVNRINQILLHSIPNLIAGGNNHYADI
jgi:surfactin synthase thioesterase subunit